MLSLKWMDIYTREAEYISQRSPDTTKVGAVIVHPDNYEIANGYNDFPRGVKSTHERFQRPAKYEYVVHAEQNALMTALFAGKSVKDCYIFTSKYPCSTCSKLIIQAGIKKVFYAEELTTEQWVDSVKASREMLSEAGVETVFYPLFD